MLFVVLLNSNKRTNKQTSKNKNDKMSFCPQTYGTYERQYEVVAADGDLVDCFGRLNIGDADEVVDITTGRVIARPRFVAVSAPRPRPVVVVQAPQPARRFLDPECKLGYVKSINSSGNSKLHAKWGCSGAETVFKQKHADKYRMPAQCQKPACKRARGEM
jgi:hypothetical protein